MREYAIAVYALGKKPGEVDVAQVRLVADPFAEPMPLRYTPNHPVKPALLLAAFGLAAGVEIWTRARWDDRKGTPGFFISHPVRIQQLAPGYHGWFAGVPVTINRLGFRDNREYSLAKSARTVRILVLGDSVVEGAQV